MYDEKQVNDLKRTILRLKLEKFIYMDMLMDYHPDIKGDVIIYGAGEVGKLLSRCFEHTPKAFIDERKEVKSVYEIPVYRLQEVPDYLYDNVCTIIVTPVWDFKVIDENIPKNPKVKVINLESLLKKL